MNHNLFPKHSTLMAHHQVKAGNSGSVKLNSCRPSSSRPCPPMSPMSQCDSPAQFQLEQDISADTSSQRDPQGCPMTGTGTAQQHCNLNTTARGGKARTTTLPFPDGPAHPGLGQGLHPTPHPKVKATETAPVPTVKLPRAQIRGTATDPDEGGRESSAARLGAGQGGGSGLTHPWSAGRHQPVLTDLTKCSSCCMTP